MSALLCNRGAVKPAGVAFVRGMTLIELLVVVAILGLLAVTVIPNISGVLDRRRIRDAAGNVSAFMSRAQSRALNAKDPKGFIIQPLATAVASIDVYFADTPEAYSGDLVSSLATIAVDTSNPAEASLTFSDAPTLATLSDPTFCRSGDSIQFAGRGPYFHFTPPLLGMASGMVRMWSQVKVNTNMNQSPYTQSSYNMVLPDNGTYSFRIRRQPTRASSGILQLGNGAAIDLRWSWWGGTSVPSSTTQPIIVLYDAAGRPGQIIHSGGPPEPVISPIYLLVGLADICGNSYVPITAAESTAGQEDRKGANWQYADSYWVAIDNKTGLARMAPVLAKDANTLATNDVWLRCRTSQNAIRGAVGLSAVE